MATMNTLRERGRRVVETMAPTAMESLSAVPRLRHRLDRQATQLRALRAEVKELRSELQESRRLNQRVAELTDLVGEVLLPAVSRDDAKIAKALDEFAAASF